MLLKLDDIYVDYLSRIVCDAYKYDYYTALFEHLYNREFTWTIPNDANRAADGLDFRKVFLADEHNYNSSGISSSEMSEFKNRPCSVLEMMVALSVRCEDDIMHDDIHGDRTGTWFWTMIRNLGIISDDNGRYEEEWVDHCLDVLLNHDYKRDGSGGLFYIHHSRKDLRRAEIWYQMLWYLDTIVAEEMED